jgi:thioredoxin 1
MMRGYSSRGWFGVAFIVLSVSLASCSDRESKEQSSHPYDETSNAEQDITTALAGLGGQKRVLLVFGANWCPDCRRVDSSLQQTKISSFLSDHYSLVKVDVGNFDKNLDISERYGTPTKQGIPALVIVDRQNKISRVVMGKELASQHKKGRDSFYKWIKTL